MNKRVSSRIWNILAVLLILMGVGIRLIDLQDAPLDFHPTRQLHSALIARGMYYQEKEDAIAWKQSRAVSQWKAEGLIEPQIMERLTASVYQWIGSEALWVARLWSIFFWTVGAIFLYLLLCEISHRSAAVGGLVFYLFWPYLAVASRAFQPEPLLVASIFAALWAFMRYFQEGQTAWAILAGALCGWALYVKVVAVFFLVPAILAALLQRDGWKHTAKNKNNWILAGLAILPYLVYHLYGVYGLGLLGDQFAFRFFPQRWADPVFYLQWLSELNHVFPIWLVIGSFLGGILFLKRKYRGFFVGYWLGYGLYGFTFSYHITTHDYYHLILAVPVSIGLGVLVRAFLKASRLPKFATNVLVILSLLFLAAWNGWEIRSDFRRADYRAEVALWSELGDQLGHESRVIGLFPNYGYRLAYWGWMNVTSWSTSGDMFLRSLSGQEVESVETLGRELGAYDYFIVADMQELERQPELLAYLLDHFPLVEDTEKMMIFNLQQ